MAVCLHREDKWAERLELLAFNALPAACSDDMWAHQYVQMSNQIACEIFPGKPVFRTNGADAHIFGLEPNFGCCTANFGQGWPKFALSAFLHRGDTVVSAVPVPSELTDGGIHIVLETDYPFENRLVYTVETDRPFTLVVRAPSFAENLTVNGEARPVSCASRSRAGRSAHARAALRRYAPLCVPSARIVCRSVRFAGLFGPHRV